MKATRTLRTLAVLVIPPFLLPVGVRQARAADQPLAPCAAGCFTEYALPTPAAKPGDIISGSDGAIWFTERDGNKLARLQPAGALSAARTVRYGPGLTSSFTVSFASANPGQGYVVFGTGPGCRGLVELGTRDLHPATMLHAVVVTGNDLPGTVGDNGIQPGITYWFAVVTVTASGIEVDSNGGKCYSLTVPKT